MGGVRTYVDPSLRTEIEKKLKQLEKDQKENPKSKKKNITITIATKALVKELKDLRRKNKK